jgi:hypothetical protein
MRLPAKTQVDPARIRAVVEEARNYLGGQIARSTLEDGVLLARLKEIAGGFLAQALRDLGEAKAEENDEQVRAVLLELEACLTRLITLSQTIAHASAQADLLAELERNYGPSLFEKLTDEITDPWPNIEKSTRTIERYVVDLHEAVERRFLTAELLAEDVQTAQVSLYRDTIIGRSLLRGLMARLATIITSEWTFVVNNARLTLFPFFGGGLGEQSLVKYLYFDERPCDGSCVEWATGGPLGDGSYPVYDAPTPVKDTHPNCRCQLVPWQPGMMLPFAETTPPSRHKQASSPGGRYLRNLGKGFLDSINPLEMWRGAKGTYQYLRASKDKKQATKELAKGAVQGVWQTLKDAANFHDPKKQGYAHGSLLPDIILSFVGGVGGVKAGTKAVSIGGKAAKAAQAVEKTAEAVGKTAKAVKTGEKIVQDAAEASKIAKPGRTLEEMKAAQALGKVGEEELAKRLEQSGRKFILDPRSRPTNAPGPDAITVRWEGKQCIIEIWDNKARTNNVTVNGSTALEKAGEKPSKETIEKWIEAGSLPRKEAKLVMEAVKENKYKTFRTITPYGGNARPGAKLGEKGIGFEGDNDWEK